MSDIRSFFQNKTNTSVEAKRVKKDVKDLAQKDVPVEEDDEDDDDPDIVVRSRKRKAKVAPSAKAAPRKRARTPVEKNGGHPVRPAVDTSSPLRRSSRAKNSTLTKEVESSDDFEEQVEVQPPPKSKARGSAQPAAKSKRKDDPSDEEMLDVQPPVKPKSKPSPKTKAVVLEHSPLPTRTTPSKNVKTAARKLTPSAADPQTEAILASIPKVQISVSESQQSGEIGKFDYRSHAQRAAPPPAAGTKEIPIGAENCLAGLSFVFTGVLESLGRDEGIELIKRYGGRVTGAPSTKTSYVVLGTDAGPKKIETIRKNNIATIDEDGLFELIRRLPANGGNSEMAAKHAEKRQKEDENIRKMAAEMEREEFEKAKMVSASKSGSSAKGAALGSQASAAGSAAKFEGRLWTVKYAPTALNQICGNKGQVEKLRKWLREWPKSQRINFKKAGPDGSFSFRAVIIHGPPGIGKTSAAHLVAKLEGYDVLESNASDTRSKKLVETGLKGVLDNTSLRGYFTTTATTTTTMTTDSQQVDDSDNKKKQLVLIMDEVDGMSAGDRGGVGALAQVCKKTNIPMILICNERRSPKMKPFDFVTYDLAFRRPTVNEIRSRIASICYREGLRLPGQVIDALIEGTHADIRQIINMIATAKLDQEAMSFDQSKSMSKAWEKHIILKPWDIAHKILSAGMFGASSNKTLNDKIELYFNDHEFSYLMLQENYLKTSPAIANRYSGQERRLKCLELADRAAESISDGDLVDRMIHGPQQHWSLMPAHAVFSTVRPASFVYGNLGGQASFTSWLGNNSKFGKLSRFVKEIQGHMRLRASGDRHEIRQQYLPTLWTQTAGKLQRQGKEGVEEVINLMDSYYLTREDYDAMMELALGPMDMEHVKIETQTKATFTRLYNQQSHPLPFMKASNVIAPKKLSREKPDLEEAIEESDDVDDTTGAITAMVDKDVKEEEEEDDVDVDLSKDKYVKQAKKRSAAATTTKKSKKGTSTGTSTKKTPATSTKKKTPAKKSTKKKGRGKALVEGDGDEEENDDDDDVNIDIDDDDDDEDVQPTKKLGRKSKAMTKPSSGNTIAGTGTGTGTVGNVAGNGAGSSSGRGKASRKSKK